MAALHEILGGAAAGGDASAYTLYIVRHGATKLNNQTDTSVDRIRGWSDVPLVEEGREEARQAGAKLKGKGIGAIVCSDLSRAHETAEIIGNIIGIKPEPSQKLRPWNLGKFTGVSTKEALPQLAEYARNKPDKAVPEGESFNTFKTRAFQGAAEAIATHPGKTVLIVTHHRNERLLEAWDKAGQPADHAIDINTFLQKGDPPGGIKVLHTSEAALKGNGQWQARGESSRENSQNGGATMSMNSSMRPSGSNSEMPTNPADRFKAKWAQTGKMPAPQPEEPPAAGNTDAMAHGRAIAGAKALHAVGHISDKQRDKHIAKSQKAIGRKPAMSFAP